ncbi:hypothetical protein BR93DRAFT_314464 [Coniochaeta sp. PMI_546]|nr:hypothetical protein BR93DRAFT_314464 [Coniochaeta sp. PMI_546]
MRYDLLSSLGGPLMGISRHKASVPGVPPRFRPSKRKSNRCSSNSSARPQLSTYFTHLDRPLPSKDRDDGRPATPGHPREDRMVVLVISHPLFFCFSLHRLFGRIEQKRKVQDVSSFTSRSCEIGTISSYGLLSHEYPACDFPASSGLVTCVG